MKQMRLRWEARTQAARDFLQQHPLVGLKADEARRQRHERDSTPPLTRLLDWLLDR